MATLALSLGPLLGSSHGPTVNFLVIILLVMYTFNASTDKKVNNVIIIHLSSFFKVVFDIFFPDI